MNDGGPAFPYYFHDLITKQQWTGMSLRDWFAGMALQGCLANAGSAMYKREVFANIAYELADAMLKAREGTDAPASA